MNKIHITALTCASILAHAISIAQTCDDRIVYSINGILTDKKSAINNAIALRNSYTRFAGGKSLPRFGYLFNPSGKTNWSYAGVPIDLVEAISQQTGLATAQAIRMLNDIDLLPTSTENIIKDTVIFAGGSQDLNTLLKMGASVVKDISAGYRVVLVGHSQGNYWANSLLGTNTIINDTNRSAIAQVGVAVPDFRLERSFASHVSLIEDFIIYAIPTALPRNIRNGYQLSELYQRVMGHDFISAYLDTGKPSELAIVQAIDSNFSHLSKKMGAPNICSSFIKINNVFCIKNASNNTIQWTIKGTASTPQPNTAINVGSGLGGIYPLFTTIKFSECDSWKGIQKTPSTQTPTYQYCSRNSNDPITTNWTSTLTSPSDGTDSQRYIGAGLQQTLDGITFQQPITQLATAKTQQGLACPATYDCSSGTCLPQ